MSAEGSVEGVLLMLRDVAAANDEEEEESGREERATPGKSAADIGGTGVFCKWDCDSLKYVMDELENIEKMCTKLIQEASSLGVPSPGNLQLNIQREQSERIKPGDEMNEIVLYQSPMEPEGGGISRSFQGNGDRTLLIVGGQAFQQSEDLEKKGGFAIVPDVVKRREEQDCGGNGNLECQTNLTDAIPLNTLGSKTKKSRLKSHTFQECVGSIIPPKTDNAYQGGCVLQKENGILMVPDDPKKVEAYWEQIARILSCNEGTAVPADAMEVSVKTSLLLANKKKRNVKDDGKRNHVSSKKLARRLGAKSKVLKNGSFLEIPKRKGKSKVLKNGSSLEIPKRKDKRKIPSKETREPNKEGKLKNTVDEDSFTEDDKDKFKKQELLQCLDNMEGHVPYEHYVWEPEESINSEERECSVASAWVHRAFAMACRAAPPPPASKVPQICEHVITNWDDEVGWYCEDCGELIPKMKFKGCLHKNRLWKDEVGRYCEDCGSIGTNIQRIFISAMKVPPSRTQTDLNKFQDNETAVGKELQFNLHVPLRVDPDSSDASLELDPVFERKLHPHQKDGFNFLAKNLVGDKEGNSMGCILAHAPGTGKTFLMISFIQSFLNRFSEGRVLILAPKIMLKSWQNEFAHWKVDIPVYCLNKENVSEAEYELHETLEQETLEHYTEIPAHVTRTLKENRARVLEEWKGGTGVLVMSYTLFAIMIDRGLDARVAFDTLTCQMCRVILDAPDLIVLDEGHLARRKKTKILKCLLQTRTRRRVILSGTLFHNNFKELYTLLKLCRDDFMQSHPCYSQQRTVGSNKLSAVHWEENLFQEEIGEVLEKHVKDDGAASSEEINQAVKKLRLLTASFVHCYPGKILESLPGLIEYSILLNLSDVQKRIISSLPPTTRSNSKWATRNDVFAACVHPSLVKSPGSKIPFFDKCASHVTEPPATSDFHEEFQGVKIEFLIRLLYLCTQSREKMVIFCTTLSPLDYIQEMLLRKWDWKLGQELLRLDGPMGDVDRQEVIRLFNLPQRSHRDFGPRLHLLLASTLACKEGISLVGASRVVILDNHDNPSVLRQAVSRAYRIGQKKVVFVYRLLTNHKEETDLFHRSVNKERLSKVLLDTLNQNEFTTQTEEFLRPIHSPSEVEDPLLQELMRTDCKGRIINTIHRYNAPGPFRG